MEKFQQIRIAIIAVAVVYLVFYYVMTSVFGYAIQSKNTAVQTLDKNESIPEVVKINSDTIFEESFKNSIDSINDINVSFKQFSDIFQQDLQNYIRTYPEKEPVIDVDFRRLYAGLYQQLLKRIKPIDISKVSIEDHLFQEEKKFYLELAHRGAVDVDFKKTDGIVLYGLNDAMLKVKKARPNQNFEVQFGRTANGKPIIKML